MLLKESEYLKELIENLNLNKGARILNIGCQNETYLNKQPFIKKNIIYTTKNLQYNIINYDLNPGDGIDIYGDIFDEKVFRQLKELNVSSIYLFNVLEHITEIEKFIARIDCLLETKSHILVSVPYKYPIHLDPIDNNLRPSPAELLQLFPNYRIKNSSIVIDNSYAHYLFSSFSHLFITILRLFTPFYKFKKWRTIVLPKFAWLFRRFEVTCVDFEKL